MLSVLKKKKKKKTTSFSSECTMEFSRGSMMNEITRDQVQKLLWDSSCLPLNQVLREICKKTEEVKQGHFPHWTVLFWRTFFFKLFISECHELFFKINF